VSGFGGPEYLPIILAFARGLSEELIDSYDGSGAPLLLARGTVRTEAEILRIRRDIEHRWLNGFTSVKTLAKLSWLDPDEIEGHLTAMSGSTIWDIPKRLGPAINADREWRATAHDFELDS
jgi:hypothetical protein